MSGFTGRYIAKRGTVPIPMKEEEIARMLKQKEFESEKEPDISNIQFRQGDIVELLDGRTQIHGSFQTSKFTSYIN